MRARLAAAADETVAERVRAVLEAKLDLVLQLAGDSPHTAEVLDGRARLFGDICTDFTARLRSVLALLLTRAAVERPEDAADICIALVVGMEGAPDPKRIFDRAAAAFLAGLAAG